MKISFHKLLLTKRFPLAISRGVNAESYNVFVGVKDSSSSFLKYLDKREIALGSQIEILYIEDFDDSLHVSIGDTNLTISMKSANNIYLKKQ